jgi:hypothetical protein
MFDLSEHRGLHGHEHRGLHGHEHRGLHGRDHVVDEFMTTFTISVYHYQSCEFESRSWRGVRDTTLCDKVCQ